MLHGWFLFSFYAQFINVYKNLLILGFTNGIRAKLIILTVKQVKKSSRKAEDVGPVLLHFGLIDEPPGVHDDLVLDGVSATLVVGEVDLFVKHGDKVRGGEDEVHCVPYRFACFARDKPMV